MGCSMSGLVARWRRHSQQRTLGQSFVEFALILPVFLLFLAATLDLGRVFYANITLNNAAREGAFQAAKTPDLYVSGQPCNEATNRVVCRVQQESAGSMIAIKPADVEMTCNPGCLPRGAGRDDDRRGPRQVPPDHADPCIRLRRPGPHADVECDGPDRVPARHRAGYAAAGPGRPVHGDDVRAPAMPGL